MAASELSSTISQQHFCWPGFALLFQQKNTRQCGFHTNSCIQSHRALCRPLIKCDSLCRPNRPYVVYAGMIHSLYIFINNRPVCFMSKIGYRVCLPGCSPTNARCQQLVWTDSFANLAIKNNFWVIFESLVGGKTTPLKNMKVSWDHSSQYMKSQKSSVPNHQQDIYIYNTVSHMVYRYIYIISHKTY